MHVYACGGMLVTSDHYCSIKWYNSGRPVSLPAAGSPWSWTSMSACAIMSCHDRESTTNRAPVVKLSVKPGTLSAAWNSASSMQHTSTCLLHGKVPAYNPAMFGLLPHHGPHAHMMQPRHQHAPERLSSLAALACYCCVPDACGAAAAAASASFSQVSQPPVLCPQGHLV